MKPSQRNLFWYHFVHHKSHTVSIGIEAVFPMWQAGDRLCQRRHDEAVGLYNKEKVCFLCSSFCLKYLQYLLGWYSTVNPSLLLGWYSTVNPSLLLGQYSTVNLSLLLGWYSTVNPSLLFRKKCLKVMVDRIQAMRTALKGRLQKLGTPGNWDHITNQIGMFSYLGLTGKLTFTAAFTNLLYIWDDNVFSKKTSHPAYYSMGTGRFSSGIKWAGQKADHSPPCNAEITNERSYSTTHPTCLHVTCRDTCNFSLIEGQWDDSQSHLLHKIWTVYDRTLCVIALLVLV